MNNKVHEFYERELWRKQKILGNIVMAEKSLDNYLNRIEKTFGKDCIIGYGKLVSLMLIR